MKNQRLPLQVGDYVRITSEGSEHDGELGYVQHVDLTALYYVEPTHSSDVWGPFARNELAFLPTDPAAF